VLAARLVQRIDTSIASRYAFLQSSSRPAKLITGNVQFEGEGVYRAIQQTLAAALYF